MFYYVAYILLSNMIKYSYMDTYFSYTPKHGNFYNLDSELGPWPWTRTLDPDPGPGPWTRTLDLDPGPWTLDPKNLDPENLDPEKPGPWKTSTLKNLDPEKPGPWKTWETAGYGKMIRRPHIMTYHIMTEQTIWKSSYRGFLGRQKIYLRIKMNSEVINK